MIIVFLSYISTLIVSLSLLKWIWIWVSLELLGWLLLLLMRSGMLWFMLWQGWATVLLVISLGPLSSMTGAILALLLKSALPPFTWWLIPMTSKWNLLSWVWFLSFAKILPMSLMLFLGISEFLPLIFMLVSISALLQNFSWKSGILASSIGDTGWMLLGGIFNSSLFIFYVLSYSLIWLSWVSWQSDKTANSSSNKLTIMMVLGLPPSIFFVLKVLILNSAPSLIQLTLGSCSVLMILIYFHWYFLSKISAPLSPLGEGGWAGVSVLLGAHAGWFMLFA